MDLTLGSLFSGIGGLDLGLERAGMQVRWQVENDPWCQQILEKHWPDVARYGDIHDVDDLEPVDVIAGGFPCQPVSHAGKRKGQDDDRWLWPEFKRIVRMVGPRYVVVENVPGLLSRGIDDVLGDLASLGYDAEWTRISARAVGAPHLRWRVFIVAYPDDTGPQGRRAKRQPREDRQEGEDGGSGELAYSDGEGRDGWSGVFGPGRWTELEDERERIAQTWRQDPVDGPEPSMGRVANGIPRRMDRLRGLGNAVVPQVAEVVGRLVVAHAERSLQWQPSP